MPKPTILPYGQAKKAVSQWRNKPEHTTPKPGQEDLTRNDDVSHPDHNEPHPVPVTDSPGDV
jgi:hypothetical protein